MSDSTTLYRVQISGGLPRSGALPAFLWGPEAAIADAGDAAGTDDRSWQHLALTGPEGMRVTITARPQASGQSLEVAAASVELAARAAFFLAVVADGTVLDAADSREHEPLDLVDRVGDFDVDAALTRATLQFG